MCNLTEFPKVDPFLRKTLQRGFNVSFLLHQNLRVKSETAVTLPVLILFAKTFFDLKSDKHWPRSTDFRLYRTPNRTYVVGCFYLKRSELKCASHCV